VTLLGLDEERERNTRGEPGLFIDSLCAAHLSQGEITLERLLLL